MWLDRLLDIQMIVGTFHYNFVCTESFKKSPVEGC